MYVILLFCLYFLSKNSHFPPLNAGQCSGYGQHTKARSHKGFSAWKNRWAESGTFSCFWMDFFPLWVPPPPMGYMRCRWHSEVFLGLRLEKWSRKDWSKVYFCILPINFVAEKGVSQEFWVYFYRKRVALVSCLLSFLFWLTLSPHLFSVPLEESGELSLFPVLIKVTCSLPRSPQGPGSNR